MNPQIPAAAATATPQPRLDMYAGIHKALRALMSDTLLAAGRMDPLDGLDLARTTDRVLELMDFCAQHLAHENDFIHTAIEARAPGACDQIAHEHQEHLREIAAIGQAVEQLRAAPEAARQALALALYRRLSLFVADNFRHMIEEETAHNALLWARYTDAELEAIHDALVASIPPQEMLMTARWLVPSMNPAERVGMLSDVKAKAPAPAFAAFLDVARPHLSEHEWAKLTRGLGLAPAPGLMAA